MQSTSFEQLTTSSAQVILEHLPERIRRAFIHRAAEMNYPVEAPLEMALAGYLDSEAIAFADCKPERGQTGLSIELTEQADEHNSLSVNGNGHSLAATVSSQPHFSRLPNETKAEFRDRILFDKPIDWSTPPSGSDRRESFDSLPLGGLEQLLEENCLTLDDVTGGGPSVRALRDFLHKMQEQGVIFLLKGFVYDAARQEDQTVGLEGIYYKGSYSTEVGLAFARFVAPFYPGELSLAPELLGAWWG